MTDSEYSTAGVASERRILSLASFLDPDPVAALCTRLDKISQSITTGQPQAAQLIHLNRILDTAEVLLYLPRSGQGFEESVIATRLAQELNSTASDVQNNDYDRSPPRVRTAVSADSTGQLEDSIHPASTNHAPVKPHDARKYENSVALEEVLSQLGHLSSEMERRAEESSHLGELVTAWRAEIVRELQSLRAEYNEALEKTLAELRYLRHKVDYLDERTANTLSSSAASSPRRFREPVVAELVETLGVPPRFSSLVSSYQSDSGSPRTLRRQIERTRQEAEMINNSISERKDLIEERVKALDVE